jgi:hypothetical protein
MKKRIMKGVAVAAITVAALACGGDLSRSASPVELVVTNSQTLSRLDLAGGANCDQNIGTVSMTALVKNPGDVDQKFNDVRITSYRVSYIRTDGGRLVPSSFVRSIDSLLTVGTASSLTNFQVIQSQAITQAPFAALLPSNGGRDPDTGRSTIGMDVVLEVFGQTLAGENVSGRTRFPLDFCYNCNGCS